MPKRSVAEGFDLFLTWLTPYETETASAARHRTSIESCLKRNYTLKRFWRTGSFGNGTSVSGYSDVDYFACVATADLKQDSSVSLRLLKERLQATFPNTRIRVSSPAVVIEFGTDDWERHEIVLVDYVGDQNNHKVYDIADGKRGWMRASPDAHKTYVKSVDMNFNGKGRSLVRFMKAWKYYCNVPISSFYLELRVTEYASGESSIIYPIDVYRVLSRLKSKELAAMQDPMGVSGLISACATDAEKRDALSKLDTAYSRAAKAIKAEENNKTEEAFYWWNLVFNDNFPSVNG